MRLARLSAVVSGIGLLAGTALCVPALGQVSPPAATPMPGAAGTPVPVPGGSSPAPVAPPATEQPQAAAAPQSRPDPVVATVNGRDIHLSEVSEAAQNLPEEMRSMPGPMLYPLLLDQVIDRQALVLQARKTGLDKDPAVQRALERARDVTLQNALITREVGPGISEAAIRARYDQQVGGKPGEEQVDARHILVASEKEANDIIAQLKSGADFQALAKKYSTDPAAQQGGDLGFFKKGDMLPEFSDAAFALQPGQFTDKPVHTRYGWHVIQVVARRQAPPPTFQEAHDTIRQQLIQEGVRKAIEQARTGLTIVKFNADGSPLRPTDSAVPPGAPDAASPPAAKP